MPGHALLLMSGIGDFLHYLTRLTAFLREGRSGDDDLHVFVESPIPNQAEAVFTAAFPHLSSSPSVPANSSACWPQQLGRSETCQRRTGQMTKPKA
jgi:hypothetical protein